MAQVLTGEGDLHPDVRDEARRRTRAEADRLRKALGLTYRDFAAKSGTNLSLINRLLRGPGWPSRGDHIERLSDALGIGRHGLADYEIQALREVLIERLADELSTKATVADDGSVRIDLEPGTMEGFTPTEVQEVVLGAKKGAVAAINEINVRRHQFRLTPTAA